MITTLYQQWPNEWQTVMLGLCHLAERGQFESVRLHQS